MPDSGGSSGGSGGSAKNRDPEMIESRDRILRTLGFEFFC